MSMRNKASLALPGRRDGDRAVSTEPEFARDLAPDAVPAGCAISFGPFRHLPASAGRCETPPVRVGSRASEILVALVGRPSGLVSKRELIARLITEEKLIPSTPA